VYRFIAFTGTLVMALIDNIVSDPTNRDPLSEGIDFINTFITQVIDGILGNGFLPFFPTLGLFFFGQASLRLSGCGCTSLLCL
jgi:hypothetical protein